MLGHTPQLLYGSVGSPMLFKAPTSIMCDSVSVRPINTGGADGIAIDIQGQTTDVRLAGNEIHETRQPMNRIGIRIGGKARDIELAGNKIEGFSTAVEDHRATA